MSDGGVSSGRSGITLLSTIPTIAASAEPENSIAPLSPSEMWMAAPPRPSTSMIAMIMRLRLDLKST